MEDDLFLFLAVLEEFEAYVDDIARFGFEVSRWGEGYLKSSDLMKFITMLRIWKSLFLS